MFDFLKSKSNSVSLQMRDLAFADVALEKWYTNRNNVDEPYSSFRAAHLALLAHDAVKARQSLERVLARPGIETRHYILAWHHLRLLGAAPPQSDADRLFGVVVEIALDRGLDVLAAYEDNTARYWNFSGSGVVWERHDTSLDPVIGALLQISRPAVQRVGPWSKERPGPPERGFVRISLLTPGGVRMSQGPSVTMNRDSLAGPILLHATALMQALTARTKRV